MARPVPGRILGVDFGISRFGLALSDETKTISMPYKVWHPEKKAEQTVAKFLVFIDSIRAEYQCTIDEILIGMPLMMSGKTGFLADEVTHFVSLLQSSCSIPVKTWDERLSSVQAERSLMESTMTRKKRTKFVDTVSATLILQSYLDHRNLPQF